MKFWVFLWTNSSSIVFKCPPYVARDFCFWAWVFISEMFPLPPPPLCHRDTGKAVFSRAVQEVPFISSPYRISGLSILDPNSMDCDCPQAYAKQHVSVSLSRSSRSALHHLWTRPTQNGLLKKQFELGWLSILMLVCLLLLQESYPSHPFLTVLHLRVFLTSAAAAEAEDRSDLPAAVLPGGIAK